MIPLASLAFQPAAVPSYARQIAADSTDVIWLADASLHRPFVGSRLALSHTRLEAACVIGGEPKFPNSETYNSTVAPSSHLRLCR